MADNPWPLAAKAKAAGLPTEGRFIEMDGLRTDRVYVIDVGAVVAVLENIALGGPLRCECGGGKRCALEDCRFPRPFSAERRAESPSTAAKDGSGESNR